MWSALHENYSNAGWSLKLDSFDTPHLFDKKAIAFHFSSHELIALMRDVFARGMPFRFKATGFSMLPFIQDGDLVTITPMTEETPRLGEVVAFVHPVNGNLIVHRIIDRKAGVPVIRGDGVEDETDGLIPEKNLLGRITRVERKSKRIRLGLGPERVFIAWLSRIGLLIPLLTNLAGWRKKILESFSSK